MRGRARVARDLAIVAAERTSIVECGRHGARDTIRAAPLENDAGFNTIVQRAATSVVVHPTIADSANGPTRIKAS